MARLRGFQKLVSVDEAIKTFLAALPSKRLKTVKVDIHSVLNRISAEDVVAEEDLPSFDRSAVDGYAVKALDTVGASRFKPKKIKLTYGNKIRSSQASRVWTGNSIPEDADSVVMLEDTKKTDDKIEVSIQLTPGENVSKKGEDISKGNKALETGIRLRPQHLGLLAALGKAEVRIFEKPSIGIFATGDEIVEVGSKRRAHQVFDSNKVMISSMCRELGAETIDLGTTKDDIEQIARKLKYSLEKTDITITTGGTSVGAADLVPEAVNQTGKPGIIVHGVAMRPGMPTALALVQEKPVLILSGNPVAAFFGFEIFGRPLISRMLGLKKAEARPVVEAQITKRTTTALGRRTFVRVTVSHGEHVFSAEPVSARGSGMISTLTRANGYVVVPENREGLAKGENVSAYLFDSLIG